MPRQHAAVRLLRVRGRAVVGIGVRARVGVRVGVRARVRIRARVGVRVRVRVRVKHAAVRLIAGCVAGRVCPRVQALCSIPPVCAVGSGCCLVRVRVGARAR
eukprot:scaffold106081_cov42-Phaeocystis_antarctica.AAC.1